jgi:hypothetical protein
MNSESANLRDIGDLISNLDLRDIPNFVKSLNSTNQIGSRKTLASLSLPNGLQAKPVPAARLGEQIVYLNRDATKSDQLQTFSPTIRTFQSINGVEVTINDYLRSFPKGGPKQRTWLDIKSVGNSFSLSNTIDFSGLRASRVIEVGIMNLNSAISNVIRGQA